MAVPLAGASQWPHSAAKNYGLDRFCEHDERYRMANEWMELVEAPVELLGVRRGHRRRPEACIFADSAKVHYVNFEGIYFRSCGLLNTILSPQESPPGRLMVSRPGAHAGETSQ